MATGAPVHHSRHRRGVALANTVSTAMLVLLESLSPLERAVFVLREAFGYSEIAELVGRSEAWVRQTPAGRASMSSSGGSVANKG